MKQSVKQKIAAYPADVKARILELRRIIYQVAEQQGLGEITESLKWGEPSYSVIGGSPIRIDWKPRAPDSVSLFFNCRTKLVDTFRELYGDNLELIGDRELSIPLLNSIPVEEVTHCILMALRYHKAKDLPLLGV